MLYWHAALNITVKGDLLLEHNFRCPLAIHAEAAIWELDHSAHGLPDRIERVDLVELFLWDLVTNCLVVSFEVQDQAQQATFSFIANLLGETTFLIRGLWRQIQDSGHL